MTVTVRLFASLRERAGLDSVTRTIAPGTTVGELIEALHGDLPQLAGAGRIAIAVNSEYTDSHHPLADGDEIALIPPVSGGGSAPGRGLRGPSPRGE